MTKRPNASARSRFTKFDAQYLNCYGCARSVAVEPYPGKPSKVEPACGFCVRNPVHVRDLNEHHEWPGGYEPIQVPMDCYVSIDMRNQYGVWLDEAEHKGEAAVESLLKTRGLLERMNADGSS